MQFADYLKTLDDAGLVRYAKAAGTTPDYIKVHLKYATKTPRPKLMRALADATGGKCSIHDVLAHFHDVKAA